MAMHFKLLLKSVEGCHWGDASSVRMVFGNSRAGDHPQQASVQPSITLEILAPKGHHLALLSLSSERQNFWHTMISWTLIQHHSKEEGTLSTSSLMLLEDLAGI